MLQAKTLIFLGLLAVAIAQGDWDDDKISIQRFYLGTHKCPPNFYSHFTKQVNAFRTAKNQYTLSNDDSLNDRAQAWADHQAAINQPLINPDLNSQYGVVGENLFQIERYEAYQQHMDVEPKVPVEYWYWNGNTQSPRNCEDKDRYKYYAQLVWPEATRVGVGCHLIRPQDNPGVLRLYIVAYFAKGPLINKPDPNKAIYYPNRIYFGDYNCPDQVKQDLLTQINYKRSLHLAPPLENRFDLEMYAQEWANQLVDNNALSYRQDTQLGWPRPISLKGLKIGENLQAIWQEAPIAGGVNYYDITVAPLVDMWYDKVKLYKAEWYGNPQGPPWDQRFSVQDFTNLVWVNAKEVGFGCRVIRAPKDPNGGTKFFLVANIGPNSNRDNGADYYTNVKPNPYGSQEQQLPPNQDQYPPQPPQNQDQFPPPPPPNQDQYPPQPPPVDQFPDPDVYPEEPPVGGSNKPNLGNNLQHKPIFPIQKKDDGFCGCWV